MEEPKPESRLEKLRKRIEGKKVVVADCVAFGYDTDMMLLHMHELVDSVDLFLVSESDHSFQNHPKRFLLADLILEGSEKISPKVSDKLFCLRHASRKSKIPWENEGAQRNTLNLVLDAMRADPRSGLAGKTLVVCCHDADEIPLPEDLDALRKRAETKPWEGNLRGNFAMYCYGMKWKSPSAWVMPVYACVPPETKKCPKLALARWRISLDETAEIKPGTMVDIGDTERTEEIGCRGWHLSWFGTDSDRRTKIETFSHRDELETLVGGADALPMAMEAGLAMNASMSKLERVKDPASEPRPRLLEDYFPEAT